MHRTTGQSNHLVRRVTRRRFLGATAALAAGVARSVVAAREAERPGDRAGHDERLMLRPGTPRARVVLVRSPHVVQDATVHHTVLGEMFDAAMRSLVGTRTTADAWRSILVPQDVVGIKFNRSGQAALGTTDAVADTLLHSLADAGWPSDRIVCIEAPQVAARHGTRSPLAGYDPAPADFGSGSDHFAAVLGQVTALINVPFLKTHNIAGMTCCLKNLSHGLIKHPARYHRNGCSPYIGDIVAARPIRGKLRLCVVDALRVVHDGGPEARPDGTTDEGVIIASFDAVAADSVAVSALSSARRRHHLPPVARLPEDIGYLAAAHRRGLGIAVREGIELIEPRV
ncbi:MAG: DUF362 domain-containing protein [Phycisphaerae bacterium]